MGKSELATKTHAFITFSGPRLTPRSALSRRDTTEPVAGSAPDRSHPAESLWLERRTISYGRTTGGILLDARSRDSCSAHFRADCLQKDEFYDNATSSPENDTEMATSLLQDQGIRVSWWRISRVRRCPVQGSPRDSSDPGRLLFNGRNRVRG